MYNNVILGHKDPTLMLLRLIKSNEGVRIKRRLSPFSKILGLFLYWGLPVNIHLFTSYWRCTTQSLVSNHMSVFIITCHFPMYIIYREKLLNRVRAITWDINKLTWFILLRKPNIQVFGIKWTGITNDNGMCFYVPQYSHISRAINQNIIWVENYISVVTFGPGWMKQVYRDVCRLHESGTNDLYIIMETLRQVTMR